jgi:hypothetical protein
MVSGGDSIGEVQGPTLQGENPRSGLNWLCLAIALLKALFCERTFLLLGGVVFGDIGLLVLSWWC